MKRIMILFGAVITLLLVSACASVASDTVESSASEALANEASVEEAEAAVVAVRLSADYANALSEQSQLALGTLQLEDSELAVDEAQAAEILPLWQAIQSLSDSETTAEAELRAVVNQIRGVMSPEQIQSIAGMQLTEDSLTEMFEGGDLGFGGFGARGDQGGSGEHGDDVPDGFGGGGQSGGPGRFPGGFGGDEHGGGPGGFAGGGIGNLSEDDIASRQAGLAEGGFGDFQNRALTRAVVALLQTKTGEAHIQTRGEIFTTVFSIVSEETGLSIEEIQEQTAEETTLSEIIEANGGDVEAVRALLIEAFSELPNAGEIDAVQLASEWLGGE